MEITLQTNPTYFSEVPNGATATFFVTFASRIDGTPPTNAELESARNAATESLSEAGLTVFGANATPLRFLPVELDDGETLKLIVESSLRKTAPESVEEETETSGDSTETFDALAELNGLGL